MRTFEKISLEEFKKDTGLTEKEYDYPLPKRATKNSAGYDFHLLTDITLKKGEIKKIPTGLKVKMKKDEVLMIFIRSSLGFKYNLRLCNQVGIIDSDYYDNEENEGHIFIAIQNEGTKDINLKRNDRFAQGIFTKFLIADNEENSYNKRKGGIGSTNKEEI